MRVATMGHAGHCPLTASWLRAPSRCAQCCSGWRGCRGPLSRAAAKTQLLAALLSVQSLVQTVNPSSRRCLHTVPTVCPASLRLPGGVAPPWPPVRSAVRGAPHAPVWVAWHT